MKTLKRNQKSFYYCLYQGIRVPGDTAVGENAIAGTTAVGDSEEDINYIRDQYGNETGEYIPQYAAPVKMQANISPATGSAQVEQFGNLENYDKVIVTDDVDCPIDENSILFVDKEPEYADVSTYDVTESATLLGDNTVEVKTYQVPVYDYIVRRVARSLNSVSIAISKVKVS